MQLHLVVQMPLQRIISTRVAWRAGTPLSNPWTPKIKSNILGEVLQLLKRPKAGLIMDLGTKRTKFNGLLMVGSRKTLLTK